MQHVLLLPDQISWNWNAFWLFYLWDVIKTQLCQDVLALKYKLNWYLSINQFLIWVITRIQLLIHHWLAFFCYWHPQANNVYLLKKEKSHQCLYWVQCNIIKIWSICLYWLSSVTVEGIKHFSKGLQHWRGSLELSSYVKQGEIFSAN